MERIIKRKFKKLKITILVILLITIGSLGCIKEPGSDEEDKEPIEQNELLEQINSRALDWLAGLDVDPIKLRDEMGIKGKKNYVQVLDIYLCLYQTTNDPEKKVEYKDKVAELIQVTKEEKYHDLNEINDTQFRQDSTSYLRAWYIINEFGFNTSYYITEIEKVLPRLDAHLPTRGTNQKMAFMFYYHQLGYQINYTMAELFNNSVIRDRKEIQNLSELDVYFFTHEIFFLYDDAQLNLLIFDDYEYINATLIYQINKKLAEDNVDLLAELLMVMNYLNYRDMKEYETVLNYLLNSQNKNGSFGYYEDVRRYYQEQGINIDVDISIYLHTTEVTLRALNEAIYS